MIQKFRKKPVEIEAVKCIVDNADECVKFIGEDTARLYGEKILIVTLEGEMAATLGDWIIKGVKGEYYPCKPDIFEATYEAL